MGKIQSNLFRIDTISSESTTNSTDSELIHKICNVVYRILTNKQVEFKKCTDKVSASVYETVCSFLNAEGGYIFLGVDDDGTILGINPKCVTDMTKSIINTLNNPEQFLPPMPITPEQTEIDGKIILYLNVPESEQVHRYKNRFYDRWGDADNDVSKHTYLVKNMFMRKEKESSENEVFPDVTLADMDEESFMIMRSHISIHNSIDYRRSSIWCRVHCNGLACGFAAGRMG